MNWEQVEGKWKEYKGKARARWGRLTDDQLDQISGRREELAGLVQQAYGKAKDAALKDVDEFCKECSPSKQAKTETLDRSRERTPAAQGKKDSDPDPGKDRGRIGGTTNPRQDQTRERTPDRTETPAQGERQRPGQNPDRGRETPSSTPRKEDSGTDRSGRGRTDSGKKKEQRDGEQEA